jgi:hypothetical protein
MHTYRGRRPNSWSMPSRCSVLLGDLSAHRGLPLRRAWSRNQVETRPPRPAANLLGRQVERGEAAGGRRGVEHGAESAREQGLAAARDCGSGCRRTAARGWSPSGGTRPAGSGRRRGRGGHGGRRGPEPPQHCPRTATTGLHSRSRTATVKRFQSMRPANLGGRRVPGDDGRGRGSGAAVGRRPVVLALGVGAPRGRGGGARAGGRGAPGDLVGAPDVEALTSAVAGALASLAAALARVLGPSSTS